MPLDCTNFVSQILRHGGWEFDLGWYQSPDNWWYNKSNQTYTWGGAASWSKFAMRRMWSMKSVWDMNMGDVLQYDHKNDDDAKNHTMFVTKKTKNDIFLPYHTKNRKDKSLRALLKEFNRGYDWYVYGYR